MGGDRDGDDPDDRRYKRVDLTDRGEDVFGAIREIVREVEAEWEERLGLRRFAQLRSLLVELEAINRADRRDPPP